MPAIGNVTCLNGTAGGTPSNEKDDLNALLYIVVTLLFYSMGIIIGIITYLKREQAEMEEDKMFEMYLQLKREPFNLHKKERVQQMAIYLKQLEERREARERVENWRTADNQQQHHPSCRLHSSFLAGSEGLAGHAFGPPRVNDAEWAETGGGPALLCSLTLGVCEPLLTPETIKRVAFPDVPSTDMDTKDIGYFHQTQLRCQCGAIKSAFKGSSPVKLSSAIKKTAISAQMVCPNQCTDKADICTRQLFKNLDNSVTSRDFCDVTQVDVQILDEALPVFQKCSLFLASPGQKKGKSFFSPRPRSVSCTELISRTQMSRKLSLDLEQKLNELAVHSHGVSSIPFKENSKARSLQHFFSSNDAASVIFQNNDQTSSQKCSEFVRTPDLSNDTLTESNIESLRLQEHFFVDHPLKEPTHVEDPRRSLASPLLSPTALSQQQTIVYSIPLPEQTFPVSEPHTPLPIQLALFLTQTPLDARPKIYPLTDIPKSLSMDDTDGAASLDSSAYKRLRNPKYDSWKKGNHRTVDIPDLSRSQPTEPESKISVHRGKSSLPRSHPPTRDNERRGALFFTQKKLHKETDCSKPGTMQRSSRHVGLLGRQESIDSSNNSDFSDSPLLQTSGGFDSGALLNLSSASSSTGSTSMSPPAQSKLHGKIPRLVRSQTEETSKLLKK
ncbi:hypothetical protein BgiMline_012591 [Biomphalaria glabrata]|nr:hypothetical protein BgiMline_016467 [Biomphalaria glabrata]